MSRTPITDAAEYDSQPGNPMIPNGRLVVRSEVARKLEGRSSDAARLIRLFRDAKGRHLTEIAARDLLQLLEEWETEDREGEGS